MPFIAAPVNHLQPTSDNGVLKAPRCSHRSWRPDRAELAARIVSRLHDGLRVVVGANRASWIAAT
jgi:hypothetical protein